MNSLIWKDEYQCHCIRTDQHHQFLFDMVNLFIEAEKSSTVDDVELSIMFDVTVDCFYCHFEVEEAILKNSGDASYEFLLKEIENLSVAARLKTTISSNVSGSKKAASIFLKSRILHHLGNLPDNCELLEQDKFAA